MFIDFQKVEDAKAACLDVREITQRDVGLGLIKWIIYSGNFPVREANMVEQRVALMDVQVDVQGLADRDNNQHENLFQDATRFMSTGQAPVNKRATPRSPAKPATPVPTRRSRRTSPEPLEEVQLGPG